MEWGLLCGTEEGWGPLCERVVPPTRPIRTHPPHESQWLLLRLLQHGVLRRPGAVAIIAARALVMR